jgi:hypothetical protein
LAAARPPGSLRPAALVLFAALALVLFVVQWRRTREEPIVATPEVISDLEEERRELLGRSLTEAERARLLEDWIDQEVLVREAYRLGLDRGDGVIRHRLLEKMRALLAERPREPSRDELLAFHREHEERYHLPARVSLEHVFLGQSDAAARARLEGLKIELGAGADFRRMGERFWLGPTFEGVTATELGRVLGEPFAKAVFTLAPGVWSGPLPSIRGLHLVRVVAHREGEAAPFEVVEGLVREDWHAEREREALQRQLVELRKRYRILPPPGRP